MGILLSKFRSKETSKDRLERISEEIRSLEDHKFTAIKQQKNIIFLLFVVSGLIYVIVFGVFYFYYLPISLDWQSRCLYSLPLVIFPLIVYLLKQFLQWYYLQIIDRKEDKLKSLRQEKRKILDKVMETETYKVAKELLEKYEPSALKESRPSSSLPSSPINTSGYTAPSGVRYRGSMPPQINPRPNYNYNQMKTPERPRLTMGGAGNFNTSQMSIQSPPNQGPAIRPSFGGYPALPAPRLARPILAQDRTIVDKLVDYVVGDGPNNRYALICNSCYGHNGMALKEEFEYLAFRCCYCMIFNPARKQRPFAPDITDPTSPATSRDRNLAPLIDEPESDTDSRDGDKKQSTRIAELKEQAETSDAESIMSAAAELPTQSQEEIEDNEKLTSDVEQVSENSQTVDQTQNKTVSDAQSRSSSSDAVQKDEIVGQGDIEFIDDENEDGEKRVLL